MTRQAPALAAQYDVVIAGGGMVGISLALLLHQQTAGQSRILVVERAPLNVSTAATPMFSPSFDARATALSYGSRQIFESIGVWQSLAQHASPIETIHVSQRGRFGSTLMTRDDMQWPALGYVVENHWLGSVLLAALAGCDNITLLTEATVSRVQCDPECQRLTVDHVAGAAELATRLLVIADGAQSELRRQLGISAVQKHYQQSAVITNVCFRRPHNHRAFERFTDQGPVALLPLSDSERGEPRAALVWNLDPEQAEAIAGSDDETFLAQLQQRFGNRLGPFTRVGRRDIYPLTLVTATEQVRTGLVVMGNAAHALHPVAGQGFNLALRDCARLAVAVAGSLRDADAVVDLPVLQAYLQRQFDDQRATTLFSDRLPQLFAADWGPLSVVRDLGLSAMDVLPWLKTPFVRRTAGVFDGAAVGGQSLV